MTKDEIKQQIELLETQLSGDMIKDMEIKDAIHNLQMKLNGVKPTDSSIDCIGCSG